MLDRVLALGQRKLPNEAPKYQRRVSIFRFVAIAIEICQGLVIWTSFKIFFQIVNDGGNKLGFPSSGLKDLSMMSTNMHKEETHETRAAKVS